MDDYPEPQFPDFDGTNRDESELESPWVDSSIPQVQADTTGGDLLQRQFYNNTAWTLWPENMGDMIHADNFGASMPTEPCPDFLFSSSGISSSTTGLPFEFMGNKPLQDSTYIGSASGVWQGDFEGTPYPGSFEAGMPEVTTSLEGSSHASSVLTPPSDWQGVSPWPTPATNTLESPLVGVLYQENTPNMASEVYFPLSPAPEVVSQLPLPPLVPDKKNPKKSKNGKRRKRVARTQREIRKEKRPETCDECPSRFAFKRDLERHRDIHRRRKGLSTPSFECLHCRGTFTLKHNLTKHLNKLHKDIYPGGACVVG